MAEEHQIVPLTQPAFEGAVEIAHRMEEAIGGIMVGQQATVRKVLACFASGGHLLLEDHPHDVFDRSDGGRATGCC